MSKVICVVGFGPGISSAVAEKFGSEGYSVALLARSEERVVAGVKALKAKGIEAAGFTADASDPESLRAAIGKARGALGPITVLQWNASSGHELVDMLTAPPALLRGIFDVGILGLLTAVEEMRPDLQASKGAVLVTNGAFGDISPEADRFALKLKSTGVALANAAKHKLVGLLSEQLGPDGIYVGEVVVAGMVKGTAWENGSATLTGAVVADKFWTMFTARTELRARVS